MRFHRSSATRAPALHGFALAVGLALAAQPALAKPVMVLGDSIGVGISMISHTPRLAHNSVSIRSADAAAQIEKAPKDSILLLSLGTNDAVGSINGVERRIDQLLAVGRKAGANLVWVGPPCVLKSWNTNAERLDAILRARLGDVPYVSLVDREVCDRSLRAADGVHFNGKGYALLWERIRAKVGADLDPLPAKTVKVASADGAAEPAAEARAERPRKPRKPRVVRRKRDENREMGREGGREAGHEGSREGGRAALSFSEPSVRTARSAER